MNFDPASLFGESPLPSPDEYANSLEGGGIGSGIENISENTGAMTDTMDITGEELKYLRDIAEQEAINRFTTAEISIEQTNHNTIKNGMDLDVKTKIAYVFQQPRLIPSMSVEKNIEFVLPKSMSKEEKGERVREVVEKFRLMDCKKSYPAKISGGQASRTALARAFAINRDVLLMDEPFKGLDIKLKKKFWILPFRY